MKRNGGPPFGQHPREVTAHNLKSIADSSCSEKNGSAPTEAKPAPEENPHSEPARQRERGFIRDYYELALEDGGVYRVFRDVNSHKWFLDGAYD